MSRASNSAGRAASMHVGPETPLGSLESSALERHKARLALALQVGAGRVSASEAVALLDMLGLREPRDVERARRRMRRRAK